MLKKIVNGYYVTNEYYDQVLPTMPHGSCGLIYDVERIYLKSYATTVAMFDTSTKQIECYGTYSTTTRKHIGAFARWINQKYGTKYSYYDFKDSAAKMIGE